MKKIYNMAVTILPASHPLLAGHDEGLRGEHRRNVWSGRNMHAIFEKNIPARNPKPSGGSKRIMHFNVDDDVDGDGHFDDDGDEGDDDDDDDGEDDDGEDDDDNASALCEQLCRRLCTKSPGQVLCRSCCSRSLCRAICTRCL